TFHNHLRKAERALLETLFEERDARRSADGRSPSTQGVSADEGERNGTAPSASATRRDRS
ncbi:hypothetical protein SAMN04488066_111100, partial [Halorubrum aquaticum]